jgi:RNA polymerase sigma-70 factor (ECF subfamily)
MDLVPVSGREVRSGVHDQEDLAAFNRLFRAEYPGLVRELRVVLGDGQAAEDVAQEAFTQLLGHWAKVSVYDRPGAWVRRVALRLAVRGARRRAMGERLLAREAGVIPEVPGPEPDAGLGAALRSLAPMQRAVVVLHYLDDLSCEQVAETLGCRPATVRVHLHRARQRLATLLAPEEAGRVTG